MLPSRQKMRLQNETLQNEGEMRRFLGRVVLAAAGLFAFGDGAFGIEYAAMGSGTESCALFAREYKRAPELTESIYFAWAQGFMSGLNVARPGAYSNMSAKSVELQEQTLRRYCDEHPRKNYVDGVMDLYTGLPSKKYQKN